MKKSLKRDLLDEIDKLLMKKINIYNSGIEIFTMYIEIYDIWRNNSSILIGKKKKTIKKDKENFLRNGKQKRGTQIFQVFMKKKI